MNESKLVLLDTFASREEAISALAALKEEGIFSQIDENFTSNAFPNLQVLNGVKLYVHEDKLEKAASVLENMQPITENFEEINYSEEGAPEDFEPSEDFTSTSENGPKPKGSSSGCIAALGLIGFGFFLGWMLTYGLALGFYNKDKFSDKYDRNSDGKVDEIFYNDPFGNLIESTRDNNFDGKMDEWVDYEDDLISNLKLDTDFNGVANTLSTYKHGNLVSTIYDHDEDGTPECFSFYQNYILQKVEWRTPEDKIVRREIYSKGVLAEVYKLDTNGQLRLSEKINFKGHQLPLE